jgi:septum formation protein
MSLPAAVSSVLASWPRLILGSTSRYRRELLERLRLPFDVMASQVDETPLAAESPAALSLRLAHAKAAAVAGMCADDVVVIGSDQVAELAGQPMGKPGGFERALEQLRALSGQSVVFHTSVAVHRPKTGFMAGCHGEVRVRFRALSDRDITTYLRLDEPYDCAGSARCETLGIALLEAIDSDDPTMLIGLPLIRTSELLRQAGLDPLAVLAQSSQESA